MLITRVAGLRLLISATTLPDSHTPVWLGSAHHGPHKAAARMVVRSADGRLVGSQSWPVRMAYRERTLVSNGADLGGLLRAMVADIEQFEVAR